LGLFFFGGDVISGLFFGGDAKMWAFFFGKPFRIAKV
jgi:hypothetical protein